MKIKKVHLRNFRRLEDVEIGFESEETVFVGPNNSGKTSVATAFRLFLICRNFNIHDFSVSKVADIDAFGAKNDADEGSLPSIEMDLWFSIDPDTEYGRVGHFLPNVSSNFEEVGVRLKYCVKDTGKLKSEYLSAFPPLEDGEQQKSLSYFLSLQGNLSSHFSISYCALENTEDGTVVLPRDPEEGKRGLQSLIRVDFVDAQRNLDDHEISRSKRLSTAFAAFYKKNLEQAEVKEEANQVIDENNEKLNKHYKVSFQDLMEVIKGLGVPSVNDRQMRIVSTLSPEDALQGNTDLFYVDPAFNHKLPEAYNGLGFKNLVYMAIQISHFHLQWMGTKEKRPLCQIIFVEEPEVHLHAQVQQTFISNIWAIIQKASKRANEEHMVPQLGITTHSSHILDAAVLVEGTVEKLLLSKMIEKSASGLKRNYLTVLEVGGAYAHRFASLLEFLDISYLVITDLDSVDPTNNREVCRANKEGAITSNASIKFFLDKSNIKDLAELKHEAQILADGSCFVAFQKPTDVVGHDKIPMHGRTFEETFTYQNMQLFRDKEIEGIKIPTGGDFEQEYEAVFERVKSSSFKKTEFALDVASSKADWVTPKYIEEGLRWLEKKMSTKTEDEAV